MDAATAAAMSAPERNPAFRRRSRDAPCAPGQCPPPVPEPGEAVELTGRELLELRRSEQSRHEAVLEWMRASERSGASPGVRLDAVRG